MNRLERVAKINETVSDYARPHPGPLPRGEGEHDHRFGGFAHRGCSPRFGLCCRARPKTEAVALPPGSGRWFPLSSGERAGVRAGLPLTHCLIYFEHVLKG